MTERGFSLSCLWRWEVPDPFWIAVAWTGASPAKCSACRRFLNCHGNVSVVITWLAVNTELRSYNQVGVYGWTNMVTAVSVQRHSLVSGVNVRLDVPPVVHWLQVDDLWALPREWEWFWSGVHREMLSVSGSIYCTGYLPFHWWHQNCHMQCVIHHSSSSFSGGVLSLGCTSRDHVE